MSPPITTCYRHPDRRAGVTCQRCNRWICPSCMTTAAVGYHCPECVATGQKQSRTLSVRQMATPKPVVTIGIIALNVLVYLISYADLNRAPSPDHLPFEFRYALIPPLVEQGEWYRLFTGAFLHASLIHLGMNMLALYFIGAALEPAIGRLRLGLVYVVSLLGGALGVIITYSGGLGTTVGASGAVYGLLGVLFVHQVSRGVNPFQSGLITVIVINLLFTFAVPNISAGGHIGGLIVGAACGALLDLGRRLPDQGVPEQALRLASVVALGAGCLAAALQLAPTFTH